ncbi:MAG TPA: LysR family transcriptional regulator [Bdellovibrionota bacterium]|nr:LysR family transcriptional regulator [Bdellovibrionota bacterium]
MITLDRLRYFVAVAQTEHVGRAATTMHISGSVISAAIKDLEESLGYALFVRSNNRIKITNSGKVLLEKAQQILDDVASIENPKGESTQSLRGHYKIGASHFLMQQMLVPALLKLKKANPQLTAELVSLDSGLALSQVRTGILDGALVFRSSYHEKISETLLHEGHFEVFLRSEHPIFRLPHRRLVEELNKLPSVSFRTATGANFWENHPSFSKLGIKPDHQFFYDDSETALNLLRKTQGWAFLPNVIGMNKSKVRALKITDRASAPVNISLVRNGEARSLNFFEKLEGHLREMLPDF